MEAPVKSEQKRRISIPLHEVDPGEIARSLKDWEFYGGGSHPNRDWNFKLNQMTEILQLRIQEKFDPRDEEKWSFFLLDFKSRDRKKAYILEDFTGLVVEKVSLFEDEVTFTRGNNMDKDYTSVRV